jgi:hypothetical protein
MTDEPVRDREDDTAELQKKALNDKPNRETPPDEPWAKTSSGDKDKMTPDDEQAT